MESIRNLWKELLFWKEMNGTEFGNHKFDKEIIKVKRRIRQWYKNVESSKDLYSSIVKADEDGYWEKIVFPASDDDSMEDAEAFFVNYYKMPYRPTYYDCTGQFFTAYHSTFKVGNKWIIYHRVDMDI